ncbi:MAG: hypothetical protein QM793_08805 [Muricomes sp.]
MDKKRYVKSKKVVITIVIIFAIVFLQQQLLYCLAELRTMSSIQHVEGDLYTVNYYADYKLDDVLEAGVVNRV